MPVKDHFLFELDPANRRVFTDDINSFLIHGTYGNVTLTDQTNNTGTTSELEQLISDLSDALGLTEFELSVSFRQLGLLTQADTGTSGIGSLPNFVDGSNPGEWDVEIFNGEMQVGDVVSLGDRPNTIYTYSGNDIVFGGGGHDVIVAGSGDDYIVGGADSDVIDGGAGTDTVSYLTSDAGVNVDLSDDGPQSGGHAGGDSLHSIENLIGSQHDDTLTGGPGENIIDGGDGADTIFGGNGGYSDTIILGSVAPTEDIGFVHSTIGIVNRDDAQDVLVAAASFAENGMDRVFEFSDGQNGRIEQDVLDFSAFIDLDDDPDNDTAEMAQLLSLQPVISGGNNFLLVKDQADNVWFELHESSSPVPSGNPTVVLVQVDDQLFEWDGAWSEVAIA